jgi:predicted RNA-binding protein (virulence factor B family)
MSRLSQQDIRDLETHAQLLENQEIQNTILRLSASCFNDCVHDFMSSRIHDTERTCLGNCTTRFWSFFKRAQSRSQELLTKRMQEQVQQ